MMQEIADSPYSTIPTDHYGRGGFLAEFEREVAALLGKEQAVFMPSGTMAQQIALRLWDDRCQNTRRVAWHPTCHLELHEFGAYKELCGFESILLGEPDRLFTLSDLQAIEPNYSTLLVELPQREIGGQLPSWDELQAICAYADDNGAFLHLDGARLWECPPYYGKSYAEIAGLFNSVYVSFYKILGGLPGAVLAGPELPMEEARLWLRRYGGNLVTLAPNAISAQLGMDRHLLRIPEYVQRASEIAAVLRDFDQITVIPEKPQVNMFHLHIRGAREDLTDASYELARETKALVFGGFGDLKDRPGLSKIEVTIGEAALEISDDEIREWVGRILEGAGSFR